MCIMEVNLKIRNPYFEQNFRKEEYSSLFFLFTKVNKNNGYLFCLGMEMGNIRIQSEVSQSSK